MIEIIENGTKVRLFLWAFLAVALLAVLLFGGAQFIKAITPLIK